MYADMYSNIIQLNLVQTYVHSVATLVTLYKLLQNQYNSSAFTKFMIFRFGLIFSEIHKFTICFITEVIVIVVLNYIILRGVCIFYLFFCSSYLYTWRWQNIKTTTIYGTEQHYL